MALYFECRINENALFQTVFLAILPTGMKAQSEFFEILKINRVKIAVLLIRSDFDQENRFNFSYSDASNKRIPSPRKKALPVGKIAKKKKSEGLRFC